MGIEDQIEMLNLYRSERMHPGDALLGLLMNDLGRFMRHADENTINNLRALYGHCYNQLPVECWGSPERVDRWLSDQELVFSVPRGK